MADAFERRAAAAGTGPAADVDPDTLLVGVHLRSYQQDGVRWLCTQFACARALALVLFRVAVPDVTDRPP